MDTRPLTQESEDSVKNIQLINVKKDEHPLSDEALAVL